MTLSMFDLTGRVALVTGSASGMGRAMALALAEAGADLVLADRNVDGMAQTAAEIKQMGRRSLELAGDATSTETIDHIFAEIDRVFHRIDILGNVAGDGIVARPEDLTIEQVTKVMHNLVVSRFYFCQQAGRRMLKAGKGSIINIGSLASITALGRGNFAYSMGMGAVAQLTRELSTEWASRGVRVNAILPAQVLNPSLQKRMNEDPNLEGVFLRGIPIGRLGRPDDIRGLSVFLASDASSWITGTLIPMDGGNLAMNGGGTVGK